MYLMPITAEKGDVFNASLASYARPGLGLMGPPRPELATVIKSGSVSVLKPLIPNLRSRTYLLDSTHRFTETMVIIIACAWTLLDTFCNYLL